MAARRNAPFHLHPASKPDPPTSVAATLSPWAGARNTASTPEPRCLASPRSQAWPLSPSTSWLCCRDALVHEPERHRPLCFYKTQRCLLLNVPEEYLEERCMMRRGDLPEGYVPVY